MCVNVFVCVCIQVYSSPCSLSLERISATIKTSNQLLLAQLEEQEQVLRLPSARRGAEAEGKDQPEKRDKKRYSSALMIHSPGVS